MLDHYLRTTDNTLHLTFSPSHSPILKFHHCLRIYLDPPTSLLFKQAHSITDTEIHGGYVRSHICLHVHIVLTVYDIPAFLTL